MAEFRRRVYPISREQLYALKAPLTNSGDKLEANAIIGVWDEQTAIEFAFIAEDNCISPVMRVKLSPSHLGGTAILSRLSPSLANRASQIVLGSCVFSLVACALAQYCTLIPVFDCRTQTAMVLVGCLSIMGFWFANVDNQSSRRRLDRVIIYVIAELKRKQLIEK